MASHPGQVAGGPAAATSANAPEEESAVAAIRWQIEETRGQISQTIDDIHARLTPRRLITDATDSVTEATTERVKRLVPSLVSGLNSAWNGWPPANPAALPTALAGLATSMVLLGVRRRRRPRGRSALLLLGTGTALLWLLRWSAGPDPRA